MRSRFEEEETLGKEWARILCLKPLGSSDKATQRCSKATSWFEDLSFQEVKRPLSHSS